MQGSSRSSPDATNALHEALAKSGACRQYRGRSAVHRVDDLAVVDALQVDRGDPEVRMAELPFYDVERDALAGHLDGVGMWCSCGCR
jgi:hypothetical protein